MSNKNYFQLALALGRITEDTNKFESEMVKWWEVFNVIEETGHPESDKVLKILVQIISKGVATPEEITFQLNELYPSLLDREFITEFSKNLDSGNPTSIDTLYQCLTRNLFKQAA